jgi:hypothetical protein
VKPLRPGAAIASVAAVALLAWLLTSCGGTSTQSTVTVTTTSTVSVKPFGPQAFSESGLKTASGVLGQPIYWAGARPGYTYEFRRADNGDIFLRYLPAGTAVGTKGKAAGTKGAFLVIATYPLRDAYAAVVRASKGKGSVAMKIPNNGLAVYSPRRPATYYFAYPGSTYQVGVFAPTAAVARRLVLQARVAPLR